MAIRIKVLRAPFKHPALSRIGMKDDTLTVSDLEKLISNTNFLIKMGLHHPAYRLTHSGGAGSLAGKSLGWVDSMEGPEDGRGVAVTSLTESGRKMIGDREIRWVSSGIKVDFPLTGAKDSPVLPGPYLDHVAFLGDENPAQKGLTDLFKLEMSEVGRAGQEFFLVSDKNAEMAYFAEIESEEKEKEIKMDKDKETDVVPIALFKEEQARREAADKKATAETARADKAEADLRQLKDDQARANFAEYKNLVVKMVKDAQKTAKFGSEEFDRFVKIGEMSFGAKEKETTFAELMTSVSKSVTRLDRKVLVDDDKEADLSEDEDSSSMFAEDGSDVTEKDIAAAARDSKIASELMRVINFRKKKSKNFTLATLAEEVRSRRRR